ncbi:MULTISPECIES: SagB family peptide dehydrogenase [Bacillales]|uniref:SagB-type dehydrogenase domain protein n=1 Tax=Anoxybacteroides amylolyticum TaxID=294699 RepID=A0A167T5C5_9BACL|nr:MULTISPECIES: SagB family peptide dehydrogenase [Bacillaceae]ANB59476.1 SagB-type dehydrogenase domain protein [Anoxybacillus amylolyticus]
MAYINPYIFMLFRNGEVIVWDYFNHQQFALEPRYVKRLLELNNGERVDDSSIDKDLIEANIVQLEPPIIDDWGWDVLSHIFHKGTQNIPITKVENPDYDTWVEEYLEYCESIINEQPDLFTKRQGHIIDLPDPDYSLFNNKTLLSTLKDRKTSRVFNGGVMPLNTLSTLLYMTFGPIHGDWSDLNENGLLTTGIRKSSPSGGGLHPEEAYVLALRVDGLNPGVYHYRMDHKLTLLTEEISEDRLIELLYHQYYARGLSVGIFITARFDKAWWKYRHSRAYRNVLLDIGHVSQTFQLCATSLGYQSWLTGAFHDREVDSFLGIDGVSESTLFFVGAGIGENKSFDEKILEHVSLRDSKNQRKRSFE